MLLFKQKPKSKAFVLTLLILWFASIVGLAFLGIRSGMDFKENYKSIEKTMLNGDYSEVQVNLFEDDLLITNAMDYGFDNFLTISNDEVKLGYARIEILTTSDSMFHYTIERKSHGGSLKAAKEKSEGIQFDIQQTGNTLNIPTRYGFPKENKFRGQKVNLKIYVPIGKEIILNGNLEDFPLRIQTKTRFSDDLLKQSSIWKATNLGMEYGGF